MSNLDEKLREIVFDVASRTHDYDAYIEPDVNDEDIAQIKQAFADDEDFQRMRQDMANLHANMKQEAIRLGLIPTPTDKLMTGQEWYERFTEELDSVSNWKLAINPRQVYDAARRAAGINNG